MNLLSPRWSYVFRSVVAAALALGVAYGLQLETPYSAASTVLLVTNPNQGAVLAKGGWRLIGTLIGGMAAITLMAFFIQAPPLFILGFGLWLGLCTGAAMVLRHFRASGEAVAGYTVGLATYGALEAPERALDAVLGRTATVAVGVVCLGVVTALLSQRATRQKLEAALAIHLGKVGRLLLDRFTDDTRQPAASPDLVTGLFAIDDLLELSRTESPDVAIRAGAVREGLAALFAALLGATERSASIVAQGPARDRIMAVLPDVIRLLEGGRKDQITEALARIADLRHALRDIVAKAEIEDDAPNALIALDRAIEVIEDFEAALIGLARLHSPRPHRATGFRFHRDWRGAIENGMRSLLAILCGGAFGIVAGWNDWSLLLLVLAPYCVLLAMTGNPAAGAIEFIKGTVAAIPAAFACAFLLLPMVQGFPLLIVTLAPFWIAGLYATAVPRFAPAGLAYLVAFNTLVGAGNPMHYDLAAFLNQAFGWVAAVVVTLLAFKLLLPHDPRRQAKRIAAAIQRDVLAAIHPGLVGRQRIWEHLQHHRLTRIALGLKNDAASTAELLREGIDALHLGRAALRLRAALSDAGIPDAFRSEAHQALAVIITSPERGLVKLTALRPAVSSIAADDPAKRPVAHRIAACMHDMEGLIVLRCAQLTGHEQPKC